MSYPRREIALGIFYQYSSYVIMQTFCLLAETTRGPTLPDRLHEWIQADRTLAVYNSTIWLPGVLVFIAFLAIRSPVACVNYMRVGAVVTVFRGLFIFATSLGPPLAVMSDAPPAMLSLTRESITLPLLIRQWIPLDVLYGGSGLSAAYLTQDLFFSGHTATTFLFCLVTRGWIRVVSVFFHIVTVALLILTHEHYTIDIMGAYFVVYAVHSFFERRSLLLSA